MIFLKLTKKDVNCFIRFSLLQNFLARKASLPSSAPKNTEQYLALHINDQNQLSPSFKTSRWHSLFFWLQLALEFSSPHKFEFHFMQICYPEEAALIKVLIRKYYMSICFSSVLFFFSSADFTCQKKRIGIS